MVKIVQTWFLYLQIRKQKQFWKKADEWIKNPTRYDTNSVVEPNCLRLLYIRGVNCLVKSPCNALQMGKPSKQDQDLARQYTVYSSYIYT